MLYIWDKHDRMRVMLLCYNNSINHYNVLILIKHACMKNLRVPIQVSLEDKRFSYYIIKTFKLSNGETGLSMPFSSWRLLNLSSMW